MTTVKIRKIGNSLGVILPKDVLDMQERKLHIDLLSTRYCITVSTYLTRTLQMTGPIWPLRVAIETPHDESIKREGGAPGHRDEGLLQNVLARSANAWSYGPKVVALAAGDLDETAFAERLREETEPAS